MPYKDKQKEREYRKVWETKEWRREYMRKWKKTPRGLLISKKHQEKQNKNPNWWYQRYRHGAYLRKLPFEITKKEFNDYWQKPCFYCGEKIERIGIDRRNNKEGYTKENIVACCKYCNKMKMAQTEEDFIKQCQRIVNHYK